MYVILNINTGGCFRGWKVNGQPEWSVGTNRAKRYESRMDALDDVGILEDRMDFSIMVTPIKKLQPDYD